jgi:aconitase B
MMITNPQLQVLLDEVQAGGRIPLIIGRQVTIT